MTNFIVEGKGHNPWENLAAEEVLAKSVRRGVLIFYLWQNEKTVVIGRGQNALRECRADLLENEGGYLARRSTGGGAVYQDLGNLCFTFIASPEVYDLSRQFRVIQNACLKFGIKTEISGRNDIVTANGHKFSGNAFSVTRRCRLHHGTIMTDVNKENLARYLTPSNDKIEAKGVRSVKSRVCNLREINPAVTADAMKEALKEAFLEEYKEAYTRDIGELTDPAELRKACDRHASWQWRYGNSPGCRIVFENRFSWGEVQVHLSLKNLCIDDCEVYSDALDVTLPGRIREALKGRRYDMIGVTGQEHPPDECSASENSGEDAENAANAKRCRKAEERTPQEERTRAQVEEVLRWLAQETSDKRRKL